MFFEAFSYFPEKLFTQIAVNTQSLVVFENTFKPKCSQCTQNDFCPILPELIKEIPFAQISCIAIGSLY